MNSLIDENEFFSKNFSNLNLSGATIAAKEFEVCEFKDCDFSDASFSKCKFIDCTFIRCNLSLVNITLSQFRDVFFDECKMIGVNWTKAAWSKLIPFSPIKFRKCIVNDSSFFGLNLEEMVLEECKAHDADFRSGNFSRANFEYTDFSNSLFGKTNLTSANFNEAVNYDIDIFDNKIKNAKFNRYEAVRLLNCLEIELID